MNTSTHPSGPVIVLITVGHPGHRARLSPYAREMVRQGADLHVVDVADSAQHWRAMGASFVDLCADGTLEEADSTTLPRPARRVTFAAKFGKQLARRLAALRPTLIVHDQFAVVGWVVANELDVPRLTLCGRSVFNDERDWEPLAKRGLLKISDDCHRAVADLRTWGLRDASPYSFVTMRSDVLNVYAEPAQFLTAAEREMLEPVVFGGSLDLDRPPQPMLIQPFEGSAESAIRLYVAFGGMIWTYYADEALAIIRSIAAAAEADKRLHTLISLGGSGLGHRLSDIDLPRIKVVDHVDQWRVLKASDLFITHHGLKSTHEAVYRETPMIGCPFHGDQPYISERCASLGLSVPLVKARDFAKTAVDVRTAIDAVFAQHGSINRRLAEAREWELEAIAARPTIAQRMIEIAG